MRQSRRNTPLRGLTTYGRSHAVRHPDCDYIGDIDIHTTLCADCEKPFNNNELARMVCENVEFYCTKLAYRLYGYTLMPDYLHVLLSPADSSKPLSYWLDVFKSFTTHTFMKLGGSPPLWQRSGYDHVCRAAETADSVLTYIANNPVRAELVECWRDWPWTKVFIDF